MRALSATAKFAYGCGQLAWAAKDTCFQFFLFFYYTQLLGLAPSLAGLAALLALVFDGISDPIVGQISDNFSSRKWGRRHPFMIATVVPFCFSLVAVFNPPADLSQLQLFAWYLSMAVIARTSLTFYTVPYMALGAELSEDYSERTSIAVFRTITAYGGGLSLQMSAWFLLIPMALASGHIVDGYRSIGLIAAGLSFVGMLVAILATKSLIPQLAQASPVQQQRAWYLAFSDLWNLLHVRSARILIGGTLIGAIAGGVGSTLILHINNFFYGFSSVQIGMTMICVFISLIPAAWLSLAGARRFGKPKTIVYLSVATAVIGPLPAILHFYGIMPPNGTNALVLAISGFVILHQAFVISHLNLIGSMLPDVADEVQLKSGMRQEGILNSAMMFTSKVTFGIGAFIAGLTVEFVGFDRVSTIADVTPDMLSRLALYVGPGLSVIVLLSAYIFSHYDIDAKRHGQIRAELEASAPSAT